MSIVLAILFQNLTTEVTGGSQAAMSGHMDIRQGGLSFDNQSWRTTIHNQIAKPYACLNFGDPDLAPWTDWDVRAKDDYAHNAAQFSAVGQQSKYCAEAECSSTTRRSCASGAGDVWAA